MDTQVRCDREIRDGVTVVRVLGEVDMATAPNFASAIAEPADLVVELTGCHPLPPRRPLRDRLCELAKLKAELLPDPQFAYMLRAGHKRGDYREIIIGLHKMQVQYVRGALKIAELHDRQSIKGFG